METAEWEDEKREEEIVFWINTEEVQEKEDNFWNEEYWLWEGNWEVDVKNEEQCQIREEDANSDEKSLVKKMREK